MQLPDGGNVEMILPVAEELLHSPSVTQLKSVVSDQSHQSGCTMLRRFVI